MKYLCKNEEWQEFVSSHLRKINDIYETELGGHNPKKQKYPAKSIDQKEEIDDFDMLFIDNKKVNEKHNEIFDNYNTTKETDFQDGFTYNDLQNDLINFEGTSNLPIKYQPEEGNLLDSQFDFISEQMSSLNFKNDV